MSPDMIYLNSNHSTIEYTSKEANFMDFLVDSYGRRIKSMRISITDKCNFRCTYCMPAEGLPWLPKSEILTFEELTRVVRVFLGLGVRSLKLTGGEPTVRAELPKLVRMLRDLDPDVDISMTTNGFLLDRLAR